MKEHQLNKLRVMLKNKIRNFCERQQSLTDLWQLVELLEAVWNDLYEIKSVEIGNLRTEIETLQSLKEETT